MLDVWYEYVFGNQLLPAHGNQLPSNVSCCAKKQPEVLPWHELWSATVGSRQQFPFNSDKIVELPCDELAAGASYPSETTMGHGLILSQHHVAGANAPISSMTFPGLPSVKHHHNYKKITIFHGKIDYFYGNLKLHLVQGSSSQPAWLDDIWGVIHVAGLGLCMDSNLDNKQPKNISLWYPSIPPCVLLK